MFFFICGVGVGVRFEIIQKPEPGVEVVFFQVFESESESESNMFECWRRSRESESDFFLSFGVGFVGVQGRSRSRDPE